MKDSGYFDGDIDWLAFKEIDTAEYFFSDPSNRRKLADPFLQERNFFDGSNKKLCILPRPPETHTKYLEYMMEGHDHPLKFATDNLVSLPLAIRVTRNLYFYKAIRDNLQRLFEAGFISHHFSSITNDESPLISLKLRIHERQQSYSTLIWDQLYPGFYLWLGALIVCVVVFIGELIVHLLVGSKKKSIII